MKQKPMVTLAWVFVIAVFVVKPAYAYLDPGTGSILLQGLIAAVAGVMVTGGIYWHKVKSFFSSNKEERKQQTNDDKVDD